MINKKKSRMQKNSTTIIAIKDTGSLVFDCSIFIAGLDRATTKKAIIKGKITPIANFINK